MLNFRFISCLDFVNTGACPFDKLSSCVESTGFCDSFFLKGGQCRAQASEIFTVIKKEARGPRSDISFLSNI